MTTLFTNEDVWRLHSESLREAGAALASLAVAEGRAPRLGALSGWVFEQVVRYCLQRELLAAGLGRVEIAEQRALRGRAKVDLVVGRAAIEVKVAGSFGADDLKYADYRSQADQRGWVYFYLTLEESHQLYREATQRVFGADRAFFLDSEGDWPRFVAGVIACQRRGAH